MAYTVIVEKFIEERKEYCTHKSKKSVGGLRIRKWICQRVQKFAMHNIVAATKRKLVFYSSTYRTEVAY